MKKQLFVMLMAVLLMIPAGAMAMKDMDHGSMDKMDHGSMEKMDHGSMEKMDHGSMEKMDHGSMEMDKGMIMLPDVEVDGVMASTHLMDTKEKMAAHGMRMTHHIMVGFMDSEGTSLEKGQVAVKVESPDGKISKANKMMVMKGQFGADVTLDQKGTYRFMVGTKLADGKKRMFHLSFENN